MHSHTPRETAMPFPMTETHCLFKKLQPQNAEILWRKGYVDVLYDLKNTTPSTFEKDLL